MAGDEDRASKMESFFEDLWAVDDPWNLESSEFEAAKYRHQLQLLEGRRYGRALEVGCGAGRFTRSLAQVADVVVGVDISDRAISRARSLPELAGVTYVKANIMEDDRVLEGPWDLIVISETIYYLGWLYSFSDVAFLAWRLFEETAEGGRLLMANVYGDFDWLSKPWLIRTYRDLIVNVGYELGAERDFQGLKEGTRVRALISLFEKRADTQPAISS